MSLDFAKRFVVGDTRRGRQRYLVGVTVMLVAFAVVSHQFLPVDWWDDQGLPLAIGLVVCVAGIAGYRDYGFIFASVGPYVFTLVLMVLGGFFLDVGAPTPPLRLAIAVVVFPALFSLPFNIVGYLLGTGLSVIGQNPRFVDRTRG